MHVSADINAVVFELFLVLKIYKKKTLLLSLTNT